MYPFSGAKPFYGWRMVAAAFSIQFLQAALLHNAFGAYFSVLIDEFGWSKTAVSGAAALQPMESAILGPFLGWVMDKFGAQGMIRVGIFTFGFGFCLLSMVNTLSGFYGAIIVIALGSSLCGYFPLNVAVIRWFERYRSRAISMLTLGLALGGTAVPLVAGSIQAFGWRATALGSGILVLIVGWPISSVFKNRPEDIGEVVDGHNAPKLPEGSPPAVAARQFTTSEALRTPAFWLLSAGHAFALLVVYAVNVHAITHIRDSMNYSLSQAAFFISIMTICQVIGVAIGGWCGDKFEKRRLAAGCMLGHAIGLALLAFASNVYMLAAFSIIHGTAWGMRGPMMQAMRADYFGSKSIGMILGIASMVIVLGQVGGPMITAVVADLTGDYRAGFCLLAVMVGLGSLFFAFAKKPV